MNPLDENRARSISGLVARRCQVTNMTINSADAAMHAHASGSPQPLSPARMMPKVRAASPAEDSAAPGQSSGRLS
jgi:hypothetical protein